MKLTLAIMLSSLSIQPLPTIVFQIQEKQTNIIDRNEEFFITSSKAELFHYTNMIQNFLYLEKIWTLSNKLLYYIQFEFSSIIINPNTFETLRIVNSTMDKNLFLRKIYYIDIMGLYYKLNNTLISLENNENLEFFYEKNNYLHSQNKDDQNLFEFNYNLKNKFYKKIFELEKQFKNIDNQRPRVPKRIYDKNPKNKWKDYWGEYWPNFKTKYMVEYDWFFRELYDENTHYNDGKNISKKEKDPNAGLCEYIALSMIILYKELFYSSGYFSDYEWEKHFLSEWELSNQSKRREHGTLFPQINQKNSIVEKMWRKNYEDMKNWKKSKRNKHVDFRDGRYYKYTFENFIKNKPILQGKNIDDVFEQTYSANFMHTSQPEQNLIEKQEPIILTFAVLPADSKKYIGHAIVIYGYDEETQTYLTNYGWKDKRYSQAVIPKKKFYNFNSFGFWYSLVHKGEKLPVKKVFIHKEYGKLTGKELDDKNIF